MPHARPIDTPRFPGSRDDGRHAPDHALRPGITVADLDAATAFFVGLGLEVDGRMFVEGGFVDTVTGIPLDIHPARTHTKEP